MTFTEALMRSEHGWVRRKGWPGWILVKNDRCHIPGDVTRHDLLADDWEHYQFESDSDEPDEWKVRIGLLELE